jgi:conjugative transfer signal peptidase TraF
MGRGVLLSAVLMLAAVGCAFALGLRLNLSGSIPPGLYRLERGPVARGVIVLACLPAPLVAFARARGYIHGGSCADGSEPVGKAVAALPGDTVVVRSDAIAVNGRAVPHSRPLSYDSRRRALTAYPLGSYVVRSDEVWLLSPYSAASFDSRYFGPIPLRGVVGRIKRLVPTHPW